MIRRPPRSTRTDTLFPYTTLFRSAASVARSYSSRWALSASMSSIMVPFVPDLTDAAIKLIHFFTGRRYIRSVRSEEHTSELQSLMRISYAVFCLKKKKINNRRKKKHKITKKED